MDTFMVDYLNSINEHSLQTVESGVHEMVQHHVSWFLNSVFVSDQELLSMMSLGFGLGVMFTSILTNPNVTNRPELLKKLGNEYTVAAIYALVQPPKETIKA
jgi:hypothetical protein